MFSMRTAESWCAQPLQRGNDGDVIKISLSDILILLVPGIRLGRREIKPNFSRPELNRGFDHSSGEKLNVNRPKITMSYF